jgi:hypothetical protein
MALERFAPPHSNNTHRRKRTLFALGFTSRRLRSVRHRLSNRRPPIAALLAPGVLDRLGKSVSVGDGDSITADIRLTNPDDLWAADLR